MITLGLRSSSGRHRVQVPASASVQDLQKAISGTIGISEDFIVRKDRDGRPGDEIKMSSTRRATLATLGLKNGDVLYITPAGGGRFVETNSTDVPGSLVTPVSALSGSASSASMLSASSSTSSLMSLAPSAAGVEDEVDQILCKMDGRIEQSITPQCQHKATGQKCLYCSPKEPYDEAYLNQEGIKHMSFHAYLRKLSRGLSKGKFAPLEDISCTFKPGCTTHKPWPLGSCSKCQPPAITLNRQPYRHVDNIMFENAGIVDRFLTYWRNTGNQRIGYLYGQYKVFEDVPLGVKAVVAAIYEPPQENTRDGISLEKNEEEERIVEEIAQQLGLKRIGWIFTDLVTDSKGQVRHFRNVENHFLSAQECIMAGWLQSKFPNVCAKASSGFFGSKFVTVCVTGDASGQVHMEGYQVSNQCMALARDSCLIPTKDAPELGFVKESSSEKFVPDVYYKEKDKYGNEVTKMARPLPVEYLLVDVPVSAPKEPVFTFYIPRDASVGTFPVENRPMEGHLQDMATLASYRKNFHEGAIKDFFRDLHLLLYLATQNVNPLLEHLAPLLEALRYDREDAVFAWTNSEHWQTMELLLEAHDGGFH